MARAFFGSWYPSDMKGTTYKKAVEQLTLPAQVILPLTQRLGAPRRPLVAVGDHVKIGQRIGEPEDALGVPIHASISGTVTAIEPRPHPRGGTEPAIVIDNDFRKEWYEEIKAPKRPELLSAEEVIGAVRAAGIVDMGGTAFPVHVQLSKWRDKIHTVIINGAEHEPYITSDHRMIIEHTEELMIGAACLARLFKVDEVVFVVALNRRDEAEYMRACIEQTQAPVAVKTMLCRYPYGSDVHLCRRVTGQRVPTGDRPEDVGCAVFNVGTVYALYQAVYQGIPLIRRVITVSGSGVAEPKNLDCPIGTPIDELFDACGGLSEKTRKIVLGGPMKGLPQYDLEVPMEKASDGLLAFCKNEERTVREPHCIRCGRCVRVCSMQLTPLMLYQYAEKRMLPELEEAHVRDCLECGACDYVCPARMRLTQMIRTGKALLDGAQSAQNTEKEENEGAAKA